MQTPAQAMCAFPPAGAPRPGQQPQVASCCSQDLQLRHQSPGVAGHGGVRAQVSIHPYDQGGVLRNARHGSSFGHA